MTWTSFHRRGDVLRGVIAAADQRRDGALPTDLEGVSATFADDLDLLAALQLKWHTRLAGRIEREQVSQPMNLRAAVVRAWHQTADELPGIRAILDEARLRPADEATAEIMRKSAAKEHVLLAVMAGEASAHDALAAAVGARIEAEAKATWPSYDVLEELTDDTERPTFLGRLKAALAA
jgi:regulator of protease activity HflC (stomatin/prohibitin superfamily)